MPSLASDEHSPIYRWRTQGSWSVTYFALRSHSKFCAITERLGDVNSQMPGYIMIKGPSNSPMHTGLLPNRKQFSLYSLEGQLEPGILMQFTLPSLQHAANGCRRLLCQQQQILLTWICSGSKLLTQCVNVNFTANFSVHSLVAHESFDLLNLTTSVSQDQVYFPFSWMTDNLAPICRGPGKKPTLEGQVEPLGQLTNDWVVCSWPLSKRLLA